MNKPTLYSISNELSAILDEIEENLGEINPEIEQQLSITQEQFMAKAVDYAHAILNFKNMAAMAKAEKQRLDNLQSYYENTAERLQNAITTAMVAFDIPKVESGTTRMSVKHTKAVDPDIDLDKLPAAYKKTKVEVSADKKEIRNAILAAVEKAKKEGREIDETAVVPGAKLKDNVSLIIR